MYKKWSKELSKGAGGKVAMNHASKYDGKLAMNGARNLARNVARDYVKKHEGK